MRSRLRCAASRTCLGLAVAALPLLRAAADEAERPMEYPVKAALLLNFVKFVEWPTTSAQAQSASVSICVLGHDPLGAILDRTTARRTAAGRPIEVRRLRSRDELQTCHILFVASSEAERLEQVLERLTGQPVLTVGDFDGFARRGGLIGFVVEDDVVHFEVNLATVRRSRLQLSSKLLSLARIVGGRGAAER